MFIHVSNLYKWILDPAHKDWNVVLLILNNEYEGAVHININIFPKTSGEKD